MDRSDSRSEGLTELREELERLKAEATALARRLTAGEAVRSQLNAVIRQKDALYEELAALEAADREARGVPPMPAPAYGPPSSFLALSLLKKVLRGK